MYAFDIIVNVEHRSCIFNFSISPIGAAFAAAPISTRLNDIKLNTSFPRLVKTGAQNQHWSG
jgi:hypothetical protein